MTVSAMPSLEELIIIVMPQLTTGSKLNSSLSNTTRQAFYISSIIAFQGSQCSSNETALSQQYAASTTYETNTKLMAHTLAHDRQCYGIDDHSHASAHNRFIR